MAAAILAGSESIDMRRFDAFANLFAAIVAGSMKDIGARVPLVRIVKISVAQADTPWQSRLKIAVPFFGD
ncbi:MAG: hypothetical protein V4727_13600 [Verrucomicrobiota bacterium]